MKQIAIFLCFVLFLSGCDNSEKVKGPQLGKWKGEMTLSDNQKLPFLFELELDSIQYTMTVFNASEKVVFDEISIKDDSINIALSVFDGEITGTFTNDFIQGKFIEESRDRVVPFEAHFGDAPRFDSKGQANTNVSGIWEVEFDIDTPENIYPAKGVFMQDGDKVTGTFRTNTGDYRYLEGIVEGDELLLSTFDGTHAFLFVADATDSTLTGTFYSGTHSIEKFTAKRNEAFELPDSNSLTFLRDGFEKFDFAFSDSNGQLVSLSDNVFDDKVVLVQIMGTWCPNCLDETRYYVDYIENNPNPNLEMVALAFEYSKTEERAFGRIERLVKRENIPYPVLLAQWGGADKSLANEKLPMLNHVLSYPTTIYIDKKGEVRKIHTGFNGPATGEKYEEFKRDFSETLVELLSE